MCVDMFCSYDRDAVVYIIHMVSTDFYKIGTTENVHPRLIGLQSGSPFELKLIQTFQVKHGKVFELELHHKFHSKHVRGEWFKLDLDDLEELSKLSAFVSPESRVQCGRRKAQVSWFTGCWRN